MKHFLFAALAFSTVFIPSAFAQKKLKKADRMIVNNLQAHIAFLNDQKLEGRKAGSDGEKMADEYIVKQFTKAGLKPKGEKDWLQSFTIYDGKDIKPSSQLKLNDDDLQLYKDFFPLAFSANKSAEAAVAVALAENGVPWFKDLKELVDNDDSLKVDTLALIRKKAKNAAAKGASAFIIYNSSGVPDIEYNLFDSSGTLDIPVVYINSKASKKYITDESAILDVKMNVELEAKNRTGNNVVGYADNGADSTVITSASLDEETNVAALLEVARLMKNAKGPRKNYLYIAYCGEKNGNNGIAYFKHHPVVKTEQVKSTLELDSLATTVEEPKGLNLVKRSVEIIKK